MGDDSPSPAEKRADQVRRWEESDTNRQPVVPRRPTRIRFAEDIKFLAACANNEKDEAQRILNQGFNINTPNIDGITALHQACIDNKLDMVEFLIKNGADVNCKDNEGWTPLHAAASCGPLSIARCLIENGADVSAVNQEGKLPIDIAEIDSIKSLLQEVIEERGVDCEMARNAEKIKMYNDAKEWAQSGYPNLVDPSNGATPLHVAAAKGYIQILQVLLEECKVDPNVVDADGWTSLHAAALWAQKESVTMLLRFGADPHLKNNSGLTCSDLADSKISGWLSDAILKSAEYGYIGGSKRKLPPPQRDVKRADIEPELIADGEVAAALPIKTAISQPKAAEDANDDQFARRRSASFRSRGKDTSENPTALQTSNDKDVILRRTHSFENDRAFYQRYRAVTARIKASSCSSILAPLAEPMHAGEKQRLQPGETQLSSVTAAAIMKRPDQSAINDAEYEAKVRRSFVPPVRDDESETRRKAHAKRVRETRRSTQGVTLEEIKSAEQLIKKKSPAGETTEPQPSTSRQADECAMRTVTNGPFDLEEATVYSPRPGSSGLSSAEATVTLPLRREPANSTSTSEPDDEKRKVEDNNNESMLLTSNHAPVSTQATQNMIQRRRRPKRRSTGVVRLDVDVNAGDGAENANNPNAGEGADNSECERNDDGGVDIDYKSLYEAEVARRRRLTEILSDTEKNLEEVQQKLEKAQHTIEGLTRLRNSNSLSEIDKREKRAMERKLSEMEEELKAVPQLQIDNERLRNENAALIRVISKLSR